MFVCIELLSLSVELKAFIFMKLQFSVEYRANWGEDIRVFLTLFNRKGQQRAQLCPLETYDGRKWTGEITLTGKDINAFEYRYGVYRANEIIRQEWNAVPRYFNADLTKTYLFPDCWRDVSALSHLYSSVFTECISPSGADTQPIAYYNTTLVFKMQAPQLKQGQVLALLGNQPALGEWNPFFALRMKKTARYEWSLSLNATGLVWPIEYKYVVVDEQSGELVEWEAGENRAVHYKEIEKNQVLVISERELHIKEEKWKGAGVVIPIFSLRSERGCGVGDFGDLRKMVDWAVATGMRVIQVLPIYDTTLQYNWLDSYPYNSISIYALHPQYVDLRQLNELKSAEKMQEYHRERTEVNALPQVDYERVVCIKNNYLRALYHQEGRNVLASSEFSKFFDCNQHWLVPYAAFCFLRDKYATANFRDWPIYALYKREEVQKLCAPDSDTYPGIAYHYYVQYILHQQLLEVCNFARSKGVVLKGDIPIGISRDSVEAWTEPFYFNLNGQAGAPPDDFSVNGQNWGFPTYNWERMQEDGYQWWINRFRKMAEYFDAYRIDHVLGFFRIWEIPLDSVHGLLGQFSPAMPMSVEEIENYGLLFRKDFFTKPYIANWVLEAIFGPHTTYVKQNFLHSIGYDWYEMKPEYDTQRKVEAAFCGKNDENSQWICQGLYALISNVLFVPDRKDKEKYHPRISAQNDYLYQTLSTTEKDAFDRLYEDYFYHRHNDFWYAEAMRKLPPLVEATSMLTCAEDLGMVPDCVSWAMNDLRILTLEIQTMPKKIGFEFGRLEENPYRSVSTIFTHDMPTLRGWWEENSERAQRFYNDMLQKDGCAPKIMPAWLCEEVVARHLYSPSMLCLIAWQDWMAIDETLRHPQVAFERINVPANPKNYWRYRMHLTLEELMKSEELNKKIRLLIHYSGRDK